MRKSYRNSKMAMGSYDNKLRKKVNRKAEREAVKRESANSEKREVTRKSKEFKAADSDFNSDQSHETIPQDN